MPIFYCYINIQNRRNKMRFIYKLCDLMEFLICRYVCVCMYVLMKFIVRGQSDINLQVFHIVWKSEHEIFHREAKLGLKYDCYRFLSQRESICFTRGESWLIVQQAYKMSRSSLCYAVAYLPYRWILLACLITYSLKMCQLT